MPSKSTGLHLYFRNELCDSIVRHNCAIIIQRYLRTYAMRHVNSRMWPLLRKNLMEYCCPRILDILQGNAMIRCEWRTEPESWIMTLTQTSFAEVMNIVDEVQENLWHYR